MELFIGIVIGLFILILLVSAHELGHAIVARRNGVIVEEFGIGMPPRAYAKKLKNGILFTLNWLPLGGFVRMRGEYDASDKKGDYGAASYWQKTKILLAGVTVNWLVAVVLLSILAITGLPKIVDNQFSVAGDTTIVSKPVEISSIVAGGAAEKYGFKAGDEINKFDGVEITSALQLIDIAKDNQGETVGVVYSREGIESNVDVTLGDDASSGIFGAGLSQQGESIKATWSAPIVGLGTTVQLSWLTLQGTGQLIGDLASGVVMQFSGDEATRQQAADNIQSVSDSVAGPVGILGVIFPAAERAGLTQLTFLTAIISLSLAIMNILPIPALDGGRWLTMTVYKLAKRKLTKEREESIQMVGFMILMGLTLLVTFADVTKII